MKKNTFLIFRQSKPAYCHIAATKIPTSNVVLILCTIPRSVSNAPWFCLLSPFHKYHSRHFFQLSMSSLPSRTGCCRFLSLRGRNSQVNLKVIVNGLPACSELPRPFFPTVYARLCVHAIVSSACFFVGLFLAFSRIFI